MSFWKKITLNMRVGFILLTAGEAREKASNKPKKMRNILLSITLGVMVLSYGEAMEKKDLSLTHGSSQEDFPPLTEEQIERIKRWDVSVYRSEEEKSPKNKESLESLIERHVPQSQDSLEEQTIQVLKWGEAWDQEMSSLLCRSKEIVEEMANLIKLIEADNIVKGKGKQGLTKTTLQSLGEKLNSLKEERNHLLIRINELSSQVEGEQVSEEVKTDFEQFARNMPGPKIENPLRTIGLYMVLSTVGAALGLLMGLMNQTCIPYFSCAGATLLPVLGGPFLSSRASSLGETTPLLALESSSQRNSQEGAENKEAALPEEAQDSSGKKNSLAPLPSCDKGSEFR